MWWEWPPLGLRFSTGASKDYLVFASFLKSTSLRSQEKKEESSWLLEDISVDSFYLGF